jgi:hypothetical protein
VRYVCSITSKESASRLAFAASNALHYVRQLISIVGRYGTLDKEFTALMDQLVAAYNKAKR